MFKSFVKPVCKVTKKIDRSGKITQALQELTKKDVLLGIPQEKSSREGEGPNNAELAYLHEHGSPAQHIPARPFTRPSIMENKERILKKQRKAIQDALNGKSVSDDLHAIGTLGTKLMKNWFIAPRNNWPPNAPRTIKIKGSDKPLIDTGAFRHSLSYVVREDKTHD